MKKRRSGVYKYSLSTSEGNWHMPALGVRTRHLEGPTLVWLQQLCCSSAKVSGLNIPGRIRCHAYAAVLN